MWFDIWMTTSYIFVLGFLKASVVFAKPCPDTQKESVKIVLQMPKTSLCWADGHLDLKSIVYFWKCKIDKTKIKLLLKILLQDQNTASDFSPID